MQEDVYHIIGLCLVQEIEKYIHSTDQIRDTIFQQWPLENVTSQKVGHSHIPTMMVG